MSTFLGSLRKPGNLGVAVLGVAVLLAGAAYWSSGSSESAATAQAPATSAAATATSTLTVPDEPSALWVGDSFTAGVGGMGQASYARMTCLRLGWACNVDAQGSTGYINDGAEDFPGEVTRIPNRLDFDKQTYNVDVAILDGGRNDLTNSIEDVLAAMSSYVDELRSVWPAARIVIVVPTYMTDVKFDNYDQLTEGVRALASRVGGSVIDQVGEGWWRDVDVKSMQISDEVHPNAVGNAYMANRFEQSLRAAGFGDLRTGGQS